jgi:hypothetical protein
LGVSFWCAEVYWWFFWSVLVSLAVNPCTSYDCFVEQNLIIKIEKKHLLQFSVSDVMEKERFQCWEDDGL